MGFSDINSNVYLGVNLTKGIILKLLFIGISYSRKLQIDDNNFSEFILRKKTKKIKNKEKTKKKETKKKNLKTKEEKIKKESTKNKPEKKKEIEKKGVKKEKIIKFSNFNLILNSDDIILKISNYLNLKDLNKFGLISKHFFKFANCDLNWEKFLKIKKQKDIDNYNELKSWLFSKKSLFKEQESTETEINIKEEITNKFENYDKDLNDLRKEKNELKRKFKIQTNYIDNKISKRRKILFEEKKKKFNDLKLSKKQKYILFNESFQIFNSDFNEELDDGEFEKIKLSNNFTVSMFKTTDLFSVERFIALSYTLFIETDHDDSSYFF
jgi:hypothetical protein